jgi:hypothetical protein
MPSHIFVSDLILEIVSWILGFRRFSSLFRVNSFDSKGLAVRFDICVQSNFLMLKLLV